MTKTKTVNVTKVGGNVHRLEFATRDTGYRWQDRDPAMEELCSLIDASNMSVEAIVRKVAIATGGAYRVGGSTIYNWLNGKTKRPQSYTMNWVGYALGYERKWTRMK